MLWSKSESCAPGCFQIGSHSCSTSYSMTSLAIVSGEGHLDDHASINKLGLNLDFQTVFDHRKTVSPGFARSSIPTKL